MGIFFSFITGEIGWTSGTSAVATNALLLETGDKILLEDGNNIGLES